MRSRFADRFNHDEEASGYDENVRKEDDPIRAGYNAVLNWVAAVAETGPESSVLDLGAGTGNLSARLGRFRELVCVDVSRKMIEIGKKKLQGMDGVVWVEDDLLHFAGSTDRDFDTVLSTYAIHHLTDQEKTSLFEQLWNRVRPGGKMVFGDLMFADGTARTTLLERYRTEAPGLLADLEEEFPWDLEASTRALRKTGFRVWVRQFSELSWGIEAFKPEAE